MAQARVEIIETIRAAALKLEQAERYEWGHMGRCNCGFLAQVITEQSDKEIHSSAMQKHGDWNEQLNDYCPTSGYLMDDLISQMLDYGFDSDDLKNLEKLSDQTILRLIPLELLPLNRNNKTDAILYLRTWANHLEEQLIKHVKIPLSQHFEYFTV